MSDILIIGAGAIGRGFLPWVFGENHEYVFIDTNSRLIEQMKTQGKYVAYQIREFGLEQKSIRIKSAFLPEEFDISRFPDVAAIFLSVGPRNSSLAAKAVQGCLAPVIVCENDISITNVVSRSASLKNVYFAIPDVITSNTASEDLVLKDPLSLVTEQGRLFIRAGNYPKLKGDFVSCNEDELNKQWTAKLFLHNTPHCVAAYLGALVGAKYVHEAMARADTNSIVEGAMHEMLTALKTRGGIPTEFLEWYARKELARFRSELLCDPVARVAREPLRKLDREDRLIGAAQICLSQGVIPRNLLTGISSAMLFENPDDPDYHLVFMRRAMNDSIFLTHVLGLQDGEALALTLREQLPVILQPLEHLRGIKYDKLSGFEKESELVLRAVSTADALLLKKRPNPSVWTKGHPRDLVSELDMEVQTMISGILEATHYAIIAEESAPSDSHAKIGSEPTWFVDPIDGTVNFLSGLPYFAVSAGLLISGEFVTGAVSVPARKELFFTLGERGAYLNGKRLQVGQDAGWNNSLIAASFSTKESAGLDRSAEYTLFGKINDGSRGCLRTGSAAVNICYVAAGRFQAAYGFRCWTWDVAGALAVARRAGYELVIAFSQDRLQISYVVGTLSAVGEILKLARQTGITEFDDSDQRHSESAQ